MEFPFIPIVIRENTAEHVRLADLAAGLTDEELARPVDAGWTVAALLAHLAFWDARAILLIEKWKREGIGPSPVDVDIINDAARDLCLAIPPRAAAELAVKKSLEINQTIEALTSEMVEGIQTIGTAVHLTRSEHKRMHLEEIERALGKG
ncbi:MAG: maleylpyruvate isomerase N-terminal domain-containing protein [Anaerolineales bacterium]|nr:maleylpyruvate isomerase N-terminal domain-containing protein [Anaerolineales bacterium]